MIWMIHLVHPQVKQRARLEATLSLSAVKSHNTWNCAFHSVVVLVLGKADAHERHLGDCVMIARYSALGKDMLSQDDFETKRKSTSTPLTPMEMKRRDPQSTA